MTGEPEGWLGGRLLLRQPPRGAHRAGTDAVLLAALIAPQPGQVVCDVGASTGAVGLASCLAAPASRAVLVERDPDLAARARENAALNGLAERVTVVEADVLAPGAARRAAGLMPESADLVLTNPPFFEPGRGRVSPDPGKAAAHQLDGTLDDWLRACTDIAKPDGRIGLIHRADALGDVLDGLRGRFGALTIRPVHPRADAPAIRILVCGIKGSRAPLSLSAPLVLHDADGAFLPEAAALHRGERAGSSAA